MPFQIEPLSAAHNREAFDCGEEDQNDFLRRFALQGGMVGFGTIWVAVEPGSLDIRGYYTLSSAHIEREKYKGDRQWPFYPRPATLIGQLARDLTVKGQGIGEILLVDAMEKALEASRLVGSIVVVVDASTPAAQALYTKFDFEELERRPNGAVRMFRRISDIRSDFEASQ